MTSYPIVITVSGVIKYFIIKACTPQEAFDNIKNKLNMTDIVNEPCGNYEVIYTLNKRKRNVFVMADSRLHVLKRLKAGLGAVIYQKIMIESINELAA